MRELSEALFATAAGSAFSTALGGRIYKGRAPDGTAYPYAVYLLVSDVPDPTFTESLENALIQWSLFSSASSSGEIEDLFESLKALYDDCTMTITGSTLLWMQRANATLLVEEYTTPDGTVDVWHYAVDYDLKIQVP